MSEKERTRYHLMRLVKSGRLTAPPIGDNQNAEPWPLVGHGTCESGRKNGNFILEFPII